MSESMIDLDFILNGTPTLQQVREFWRDGEFFEEHYLVTAIRRHLLTEDQRTEMHERRVSIEDALNGRAEGDMAWMDAIYEAWNKKLGFHSFGP